MSKNMYELHGCTGTKLHLTWNRMRSRCKYSHKDYRDRGITICDEWAKSFTAFKDWALANGFDENLSIDRIDNDGNYEPSNCRWATRATQSANQRVIVSNNTSGYKGVSKYKDTDRFVAYINVEGKRTSLGTHKKAIDGARAYNEYVIKHKLDHSLNEIGDE